MKKALLILCLLGLFALSACTRNHGDIGVWFGTWHVESVTAGGTPVNVVGDYFFQFQSTVFRVSQVYGHEQLVESFGTWEEQGSTMTIDFPDSDVFYIQMPGLESHNAFTMSDVSSKKATFTKVDATGVNYTYQLKKSY